MPAYTCKNKGASIDSASSKHTPTTYVNAEAHVLQHCLRLKCLHAHARTKALLFMLHLPSGNLLELICATTACDHSGAPDSAQPPRATSPRARFCRHSRHEHDFVGTAAKSTFVSAQPPRARFCRHSRQEHDYVGTAAKSKLMSAQPPRARLCRHSRQEHDVVGTAAKNK